MAVSPFDGANRIRFKGSLDFTRLSAAAAAPPKAVCFQPVKEILEPFHSVCKPGVSKSSIASANETAPTCFRRHESPFRGREVKKTIQGVSLSFFVFLRVI